MSKPYDKLRLHGSFCQILVVDHCSLIVVRCSLIVARFGVEHRRCGGNLARGNAPGATLLVDQTPKVHRKCRSNYSAALRLGPVTGSFQGRCPWLNYGRTFGAHHFATPHQQRTTNHEPRTTNNEPRTPDKLARVDLQSSHRCQLALAVRERSSTSSSDTSTVTDTNRRIN